MIASLNQAAAQSLVTSQQVAKSKSDVFEHHGGSSSHSMLFDRDDDEDEEESENILDDSEIKPRIEFVTGHGK